MQSVLPELCRMPVDLVLELVLLLLHVLLLVPVRDAQVLLPLLWEQPCPAIDPRCSHG